MVNRALRHQPMKTMRIEEIIKIQEEISEKTSGPLYTMVLCMEIVNITKPLRLWTISYGPLIYSSHRPHRTRKLLNSA